FAEMSFHRSSVLDVKTWMMRADELVKTIEDAVARNLPDTMTQNTIDPQQNEEVARGVVELGYRDVKHFCESFPGKFQVDEKLGIISPRNNKGTNHANNPEMSTNNTYLSTNFWTNREADLCESILQAVAFNYPDVNTPNNVDPDSNSFLVQEVTAHGYSSVREFCASNPGKFYISTVTGVIGPRSRAPKPPVFPSFQGKKLYLDPKTGALLKDRELTMNVNQMDTTPSSPVVEQKQPIKVEEKLHFKLTTGGATRRFAISRGEADLLSALKARVLKITGTEDVTLFWKDEDSTIILECDDDLAAAIDYAETQNKLACVTLETGGEPKKEEKEKKVVTSQESGSAFAGYPYMCDGCDCYLAPSNGGRFKCAICDNYDLCIDCLTKGVHGNHAFVRLLNGDTEIPLSNEIGAVLSMKLSDAPRCSPTFVVKSGDSLKKAEKIVIDVIDTVGRHVGQTMVNTAEWIKKEAEKMKKSREEAEIEEQKMVEEIIRREQEEAQKKWDKRRADARRQAQMDLEKAVAEKEEKLNSVDTKTRLEQLERDRKLAEQMYREEKRMWKGTRKQFKREAKDLRRAEKVQSRIQKGAEKAKEEVKEKPEEKQEPKGFYVSELEYSRPSVPEGYVRLSSESSEDSDVEWLEKPAEKVASITSDLVDLGEPAAPAPPVPSAASAEQQREANAFASAIAEAKEKRAENVAALTEKMKETKIDMDAAESSDSEDSSAQRRRDTLQHLLNLQQQQAAQGVQQRSIYPELPRPVPLQPFGVGRDVRQRGGDILSSLEREAEIDDAYALALRIPPLMEIGVINNLQKLTPEEIERKLSEMIKDLEYNARYNAYEHVGVQIFGGSPVSQRELITIVANDLTARLRSLRKIVINATRSDVLRMLENRVLELQNSVAAQQEIDEKDQEKAEALHPILFKARITHPGPFGFGAPLPFEMNAFGQGLSSLMDLSRDTLGGYLSGFMHPNAYGGPYGRNDAVPMPAPSRPTPPPSSTAPPAPPAPAASAAPAAAASAPAEEKQATTSELKSEMTNDQQRILRQLFETGMFEDYDRMVRVSMRANDLHEAIDLMLLD
ncbi:hypothetical protein PMAYCL1PPCAC_28628, partial [Pristionchus mayeri]